MFNNKHNSILKHSSKDKCICVKFEERRYVASAGCADDDAAVAALPDMWVPKHSGPILANYLKQREQHNEDVLKDSNDGAKVINENIDSKIRELSEILLAHIQHNQKEICCVVQNCDMGDTALEKDVRDVALKQIYQLQTQRVDEMARFKREASLLERERVDGLRVLLRDQFQRLIAIGHHPPRDLLHDFDERAYEINQQLLSNVRAYADLEAQLRVQVDESVRRARSTVNQLCLGTSLKSRRQSAVPCATKERLSNAPRSASALVEKKPDSTMPSLSLLMDEVEGMDACVMRYVQAYKAAVIRVFNGFSDKLCDLEKDLEGGHSNLNPVSGRLSQVPKSHEIIDKTVCCLSNTIFNKNKASRELLEMTGADMLAVQTSLWSLGECLQDTFNILHDAGHLWDAHIIRQALAQKLTIAAVEDLWTSNDAIELASEVTFNIALEQLRGCSDAEKVQLQYDVVVGLLDRTADMYRQHSEAELSRLEEYMNIPKAMADTLLSEFNCFLDKHPRLPVQPIGNASNNNDSTGSSPKSPSVSNLQFPLPRAILQTKLQELSLRNWRNGFLETFECNVSLVPEELRRQAQFWVEERANALHMRYSLKMISHSVRVERVKAARLTRIAELRHHETRLESHLGALYHLIETLLIEVSEFSSLDAPYLYPLSDWISRMQASVDTLHVAQDPPNPEVRVMKLRSYASRLAKHRLLFEESLNNAVEIYQRQIEHRIQNARISNVRFMGQMKLFNEQGRYSAFEATKACSSQIKGADALEACVHRVMAALNHRRNHLLTLADSLIAPLEKICQEILPKSGTKKDNKRSQSKMPSSSKRNPTKKK